MRTRALALPLVFAAALHLAALAVIFRQIPESGAVAAGSGGLEIALGAGGAASAEAVASAPGATDELDTAATEAPEAAEAVEIEKAESAPPPPAESMDAREAEPFPAVIEAVEASPPDSASPSPAEPLAAASVDAVPVVEAAPEPERALAPVPQPKPERRKVDPPRAVAGRAPDASDPVDPRRSRVGEKSGTEAAKAGARADSTGDTTSAAPRAGGAAPSAPAAGGGGDPGVKRDYAATLAALLARHKRYPRRAQARRQEGTGLLYFVVEANGALTTAEVRRSSGHGALDEEILALVRRVGTFPPIPPEVGVARLELVVPISFTLR